MPSSIRLLVLLLFLLHHQSTSSSAAHLVAGIDHPLTDSYGMHNNGAIANGTSLNERLARSPDSAQIQHWKMAFSDDLTPSHGGVPRLWPDRSVSCHWALNGLCLRHVSCRELWALFRRNCAVDAQNQCQMSNKNDCWQSFEGISWTGLGSCTCAGNNSDCHWIRLQTNYNKCIYELNNDADWHTKLTTAAQFSAKSTMNGARDSVGVERWREERQWHQQGRVQAMGGEVISRENWKNEETKKGGTRTVVGKMREESKRKDNREKEAQREEREEEERRQRKKSEEEERRKRIAKEEERRKRYEEERRRRWREEQRRETKKEEGKEWKQRGEEKQTEEREHRNWMENRVVEEERKRADERVGSVQTGTTQTMTTASSSRRTTPTINPPRSSDDVVKVPDTKLVHNNATTGNSSKTSVVVPSLPSPTLAQHRILPTAQTQQLMTQAERPPTRSPWTNRTTTTTTAPPPTTTTSEVGPKSVNSTPTHGADAAPSSPNNISTTSSTSTRNTTPANSSSSSSTCPIALSQCDMDELCRWHLGELRTKCAATAGGSGVRGVGHGTCDERRTRQRQRRRTPQCAQALHRFVDFVHAPLAQAMVFCMCASDDANCRRVMAPFLDECSADDVDSDWMTINNGGLSSSAGGNGAVTAALSRQPTQWTCTQTMKLCRLDIDCRRRLSILRSACPIGAASPQNVSAVRCAIPILSINDNGNENNNYDDNNSSRLSLSACRAALTAARGTWLDETCYCPASNGPETASCAELAETKWPVHPCVGMVRHHFNEQLRYGQLNLEAPSTQARRRSQNALGVVMSNKNNERNGSDNGQLEVVRPEVTAQKMPQREHQHKHQLNNVNGRDQQQQGARPHRTNGANQRRPTPSALSMVTVPRRDEDDGETVGAVGNAQGRHNEGQRVLYEWKWTTTDAVNEKREEEEEAEENAARKLDNEDNNAQRLVGLDGRGGRRNKAEERRQQVTKKRNNGTEDTSRQQQDRPIMLKTDKDDDDAEAEAEEQKQQGEVVERRDQQWRRTKLMSAHERHRTATVPLLRPENNGKALPSAGAGDNEHEEERTATFVTTPKLPIEGEGCLTRNVDGEWITHHGDSTVFRDYHDWAGRCSSWCECKSNGTMQCHPLGCLGADAQCDAPRHTTIGFGQRLYLEDRGACQCHDGGRFICDTSELMGDLPTGLYISMGYSKAELDMIRTSVPKTVLERSGLISQSASFAKDLAARLQFALERLLPEGTKCRVVLREHFAQEQVLLMQLQWFGVEPPPEKTATMMPSKATQNNDDGNGNERRKSKWQSGKWEKLCAPYVRELELSFVLERADRYQLLLSTIKQLRVIDLLEGLPPPALLLLSSSPTGSGTASSAAAVPSAPMLPNLLLLWLIMMIWWQQLCSLFLFKLCRHCAWGSTF